MTPDRAAVPWVTDITYVPTRSGMAYVCFIVDVFSRRIVGWNVATTLKAEVLPLQALEMAAWNTGGDLTGLTHHSDHGSNYMSLVYTPMWVEGLVAGRGWIALALTAFATWRPARVLLGSQLFGGVTIAQFYLQGMGVTIPSQILSMAPYVATIVVLALISRNPDWIRLNMPASLGKPFRPGAS